MFSGAVETGYKHCTLIGGGWGWRWRRGQRYNQAAVEWELLGASLYCMCFLTEIGGTASVGRKDGRRFGGVRRKGKGGYNRGSVSGGLREEAPSVGPSIHGPPPHFHFLM